MKEIELTLDELIRALNFLTRTSQRADLAAMYLRTNRCNGPREVDHWAGTLLAMPPFVVSGEGRPR